MEAEELRVLLRRGLEVLEAVGFEAGALRAGQIPLKLRKELHLSVTGCVVAAASSSLKFEYSWYEAGNQSSLQAFDVQEFEGSPWDESNFLHCQLHLSLPLYLPQTATPSEYEEQATGAIRNIVENLKGSEVQFGAEGLEGTILLSLSRSANPDSVSSPCSSLRSAQPLSTPGGQQIPAPGKLFAVSCSSMENNTSLLMQNLPARTLVAVQLLKLNVDVLCVAPSHISLVESAKSPLIPGLCDQLMSMSQMVKKNALQNPKVQTPRNKARAPLLTESFPTVPRTPPSQMAHGPGDLNETNKTIKQYNFNVEIHVYNPPPNSFHTIYIYI